MPSRTTSAVPDRDLPRPGGPQRDPERGADRRSGDRRASSCRSSSSTTGRSGRASTASRRRCGFPVWNQAGNLVTLGLQADYVNATDTTERPAAAVHSAVPRRRDPRLSARALHGRASAGCSPRRRPGAAIPDDDARLRQRVRERGLPPASSAGSTLEAFLQAHNLLDQTIRYSTSYLKDIAPRGPACGARRAARGVLIPDERDTRPAARREPLHHGQRCGERRAARARCLRSGRGSCTSTRSSRRRC